MNISLYERFKIAVNLSTMPCAVLSVEKLPDGKCGDIRFFAINEVFKKSYWSLFQELEAGEEVDYDSFHETIEGQLYTAHLPKEPKFESICFQAAWEGKYIHTYVDTTKMYGYWTEDILSPVACEHEPNIAYCQFAYTLNKEMDAGKFGNVMPDVSSFVIKACLELRNENDFYSSMNVVTNDIREFTDSASACIITADKEQRIFNIVSESVKEGDYKVKDIFDKFPFEIVGSWESLVAETNNIIIKDENDMKYYEGLAPAWVKTMREWNVESLCLSPFVHHGYIIGYLYITNFNVEELNRIKDTVELVSFFLTAEVANHAFMEKLEYLSNVDMLTGVFNRNCMNVNVDELSLKLSIEPKPFSVAFFDLNGLKTINDNGGHNSGDQLLKDAANVLKEVFPDDKIYRAGGDEFVVISVGDTEDEFLEKLAMVRDKANDPDWLNFAIGHYHDESTGDLRKAMRFADENMYEDKNAFYDMYPEKRR
ncbi:MAG: GGDEF domain-containing protein [Pseudobutyrivibrio ruminis]|nr:GGDEF domain-containing protein [Pseudobutyrivibrio ruminis]